MPKVLIGNFRGPVGLPGDKGDKGEPGKAATIQVGTVRTVAPDAPATVTNTGTATEAVLEFEIPRGKTNKILTDTVSGQSYEMKIENGLLKFEEVETE